MNFFFDRNMPRRLAHMVDIFELDHTVRHHDDDARFNPRTTDVEWLKGLAEDSAPWIIVSGDGRILRNAVERRALEETGFTYFCLSKQWLHMSFRTEYAWKFIKVWPQIVSTAETTTRRIFEVGGGAALKIEARD
jgi:hypothetical protein